MVSFSLIIAVAKCIYLFNQQLDITQYFTTRANFLRIRSYDFSCRECCIHFSKLIIYYDCAYYIGVTVRESYLIIKLGGKRNKLSIKKKNVQHIKSFQSKSFMSSIHIYTRIHLYKTPIGI